MQEINFIALIVAALIPNIIGAIYFGPLFGKQWLGSLNMTREDFNGRNDALIYGSALLLSFIISFFLKFVIDALHTEVGANGELVSGSFHTFFHGATHGIGLAIGFVIPVIISLGLFQKTKGKNIILNSVFWLICFAIMGGILDVWT